MFRSHKSFPFFLLKKNEGKITVSLTHKIFCNRAAKHELLIGIVLTQVSVFTSQSATFGKETTA